MGLRYILKNRVVRNASWLIAGRIIQMILSFFIGLLTARYLGPGNYGLISYAGTYGTFFAAFCTLGINSVIVKDFVDHPDEEGTTLCTAIILRILASITSMFAIIGISSFVDRGEPTTRIIVAICALNLVFQVFDTYNYWFQAHLLSKYSAIATLIAYSSLSVYRVVLLVLQKDVYWFAFATSIDYIVLAIVLAIAYKMEGGPKFGFSWQKGKALLKASYHFILSSMMISIYGATDKFMLKQMVDETNVGYYTTAVSICNIWVFILQAIIDSLTPVIMEAKNKDQALYERRNKQLYAIVFYMSALVSVLLMIFGNFIVKILYGDAYMPSVMPLRIITWYTAFSYLGVARNPWTVCENKQKYLKYLYAGAAGANVVINALLIPVWGPSGAAFASLITQMSTILVFPAMIKDLCPNVKLMLEAIMLKDTFGSGDFKQIVGHVIKRKSS